MKVLSKLKLLFEPTEDMDAVNKKYVDNALQKVGGSSSTYYGKIVYNELTSSVDLQVSGIDSSKITTSTLLVLDCNSSTSAETNFTDTVTFNSVDTTFHIVDKRGNPVRHIDIINSSTVLLSFNGTDFILLTKQYLLDSYQSSSITEGATAKSVKSVHDYFTNLIGDIPAVLDSINRKEV